MQARCPRCAAVFSTDRSGLQFCPNCGQQVDVPSFPGAPPESSGAGWGGPTGPGGPGSSGPGPAVREDTPWERRATVGWFGGLFETWKRTLFQPQAFWASVRPDGSWIDALIYAWILWGVAQLIALPLMGLSIGWYQELLHRLPRDNPMFPEAERWLGMAGGLSVGVLVFRIVLFPVFLVIGSALLHLCCMVFGVAKNGYLATLRTVAYALAPTVFTTIPCIGVLASAYILVLLILGLAPVQESTTGRAAAAVLAPLLLVCLCCCGVIFLGAASMAALLNQTRS